MDIFEQSRSEALGRCRKPMDLTAAARFEAVITTAAMDEAGKNNWCRQHVVYPTNLRSGAAVPLKLWLTAGNTSYAAADTCSLRRIKGLERELKRKEKALAETATLLVLS